MNPTWCVSEVVKRFLWVPTSIPSIRGSPVISVLLRHPSPPSDRTAFSHRAYAWP